MFNTSACLLCDQFKSDTALNGPIRNVFEVGQLISEQTSSYRRIKKRCLIQEAGKTDTLCS
jgi:hypothetical protein